LIRSVVPVSEIEPSGLIAIARMAAVGGYPAVVRRSLASSGDRKDEGQKTMAKAALPPTATDVEVRAPIAAPV
jgi:hypothetical protein